LNNRFVGANAPVNARALQIIPRNGRRGRSCARALRPLRGVIEAQGIDGSASKRIRRIRRSINPRALSPYVLLIRIANALFTDIRQLPRIAMKLKGQYFVSHDYLSSLRVTVAPTGTERRN
jgi:hypothetical protein